MITLSTIKELREWRKSITPKALGFVPTMGALHAGHESLLKFARLRSEKVLLSIFVNPTQFSATEDLSKYPRTLENDLAMAKSVGVDAVFVPASSEIYPSNYSTYIIEEERTAPLCGKFRPTHFRGVTTIVFRLFHWAQPQFAFFGLKDAQQYFVIKKMVDDLDLGVQMIGVPTVREADGLALSSRNVYLTPKEREKAPLLYHTLQFALSKLLENNEWELIQEKSLSTLAEAGFRTQYLEYLTIPHLEPVEPGSRPPKFIVAYAGNLGATRLIDNIILGNII